MPLRRYRADIAEFVSFTSKEIVESMWSRSFSMKARRVSSSPKAVIVWVVGLNRMKQPVPVDMSRIDSSFSLDSKKLWHPGMMWPLRTPSTCTLRTPTAGSLLP